MRLEGGINMARTFPRRSSITPMGKTEIIHYDPAPSSSNYVIANGRIAGGPVHSGGMDSYEGFIVTGATYLLTRNDVPEPLEPVASKATPLKKW